MRKLIFWTLLGCTILSTTSCVDPPARPEEPLADVNLQISGPRFGDSIRNVEAWALSRGLEFQFASATESGALIKREPENEPFTEIVAGVVFCDGKLVMVTRKLKDYLSFYEVLALLESFQLRVGSATEAKSRQDVLDPIGLVRSIGLVFKPRQRDRLEVNIAVVPNPNASATDATRPAWVNISHRVSSRCFVVD